MSSSVPENISRRIRAIRYIGIFGVVMCHAVQQPYFFLNGEYLQSDFWGFSTGELLGFVHSLIIYGLFYGAVPMFFLFAGYLQFIKPRAYGETVMRRVRSLLVPMALWSLLSIAAFLTLKAAGLRFYPNLFSSADPHLWFRALAGNYARAWVRGTHCPELMFQFWFIRDLFVLTLLSPVIGFLLRGKRRGMLFLLVAGACLAAGYRPVIAGGDALFYFSLGAFFALRRIDFLTMLDRFWSWLCAAALFCFAVAWMYCNYNGDPDPDVPMWVQLGSALLLMKFSGVAAASEKLFRIADYLDVQAFFLYCAHAPVVLALCAYCTYYALPDTASEITSVAAVVFMGVVEAAFCTGVGMSLKRFLPGVFALLTGGRVAVKKAGD